MGSMVFMANYINDNCVFPCVIKMARLSTARRLELASSKMGRLEWQTKGQIPSVETSK